MIISVTSISFLWGHSMPAADDALVGEAIMLRFDGPIK